MVKINDRGPVVPGRIIDLSFGAAQVLQLRAARAAASSPGSGKAPDRTPAGLPDRSLQPSYGGTPVNQLHCSGCSATLTNRIPNDTGVNPAREKLIVALDVSTAAAAQKIVAAVGDSALTYKVGMQLYTAEGPQVVRDLVASGRRVFLDLKYHDIPTTVAAAVHEASRLGVSMLTVHAAGGGKMLHAAVDAARANNPALLVLGVTVLTSLDENEMGKVGFRGTVREEVLRLASAGPRQRMQGHRHLRPRNRGCARRTRPQLRHRQLPASARPAHATQIKPASPPPPKPSPPEPATS